MIRIDCIDTVLKLISELQNDNITFKIMVHDEEYWHDTPQILDRWRICIAILSQIGQFYFIQCYMLTDTTQIDDLKNKIKDFNYLDYPIRYCNNELIIG